MNPLHGDSYSFWSGIGNDIPIYLFGFVPLWWQHHKCHIKGCYRLGKHPFKDYVLCGHHHPRVPSSITVAHIDNLRPQVIINEKEN
jgi:hypothetical protein